MGGVPSLFRIVRYGATVKEGTTGEELTRLLERAKGNVSNMKFDTAAVMLLTRRDGAHFTQLCPDTSDHWSKTSVRVEK